MAESDTRRDEQWVIRAARANQWELVKEAMIGGPDKWVRMSAGAQDIVLLDAMMKERWSFIVELVMGNFTFGPRCLDKVLEQAVQDKNFRMMETLVLISTHPYKFDSDLLVDAMARFCKEDDWLDQAYELANRLPSDISLYRLDKMVYGPLKSRRTEKIVQVNNILNRLRTRFEPVHN